MKLSDFFKENKKAAIAFSGGVDSTYLLYMAIKHNAIVQPYYVKSAFQPRFELNDARQVAQELHINIKVLEVDVFSEERILQNQKKRCYNCKKLMFSIIEKEAEKDGYTLLLDGTNASDKEKDRPGMCALKELSVRSPLRECGIRKEDIRRLSREAGLFTWKKPAYACLATRVPNGVRITKEMLMKTEAAEDFLFSLGFTDFRIRILGTGDIAKIQIPLQELQKVVQERERIVNGLKKYYSSILLDLEVRDEK